MPQAFLSPEEEELERKLAELATVESELFMAEAGLESLRSELRDFEDAYMKAVGPCYAAMEELQAEAISLPKDGEFASSCSTAAHQAEFCSPGELKSLFREVAKHIHPDLAISEEDRRKRDEFMAGANAAYANGNDAHLRDLLMQFKGDPEAIIFLMIWLAIMAFVIYAQYRQSRLPPGARRRSDYSSGSSGPIFIP